MKRRTFLQAMAPVPLVAMAEQAAVAAELEPEKKYLVVCDPRWVSPRSAEQLGRKLKELGVNNVIYLGDSQDAIRIYKLEDA